MIAQSPSTDIASGRHTLGVRYAKSLYNRELHLQQADTTGDVEIYRWDSATGVLSADRPAGWMYGLLDMADHTAIHRRIPDLAVRSYHRWLPFYLGQGYGQEGYSDFDHRAEGWWYDHDWWLRFFQGMAEARLNMLVLWNVHPYPALIEFDEFPEANEFNPERRRRNVENFRLILRLAGEFGVEVVIMQYNIHVASGFALKHGIAKEHRVGFGGGDTPLNRRYNAYCVRKLFETYPQISGLMMCFELNKNAQGFLEEAILRPLQDIPHARLHFRLWGQHFPDDVRRICNALPGRVSLWHKATEEIIAIPGIDSRVAWWHRHFPDVPMNVLVGPSNASGYNFLGRPFIDPLYFSRQFVELKRIGGSGIGFTGGDDNQWINDGELSKQSDAMRRWEAPAWLMRHVVGRVAWDLSVTTEDISHQLARLLQMDDQDAHSLLHASMLSSRADLPFWRLNSTYAGQNLGFGGAAGRYSMQSQAYAPGTFRLSGPYAMPQHDWGLRQTDVLAAVRDPATLAEPFAIAAEIESDANAAEACLAGRQLFDSTDHPGTIIGSYSHLNSMIARYHARLIRAAAHAHRATRCAQPDEAIERLLLSADELMIAARCATQIGTLARLIPVPETSQRPDLPSPQRIEQHRGTLIEEADQLRHAADLIAERPSTFGAIHYLWDGIADTYDLLRHIPPRACHIEETQKAVATSILDSAIAKLRRAYSIDGCNLTRNWLEVLEEDRHRLTKRMIRCGDTAQEIGWRSRDFTADFPLAQMLASIVPGQTRYAASRRTDFRPAFDVEAMDTTLFFRLHNLPRDNAAFSDLRILLQAEYGRVHRIRVDLSKQARASGQVATLTPPHALRFLESYEPDVRISRPQQDPCIITINCQRIFGSSLPARFGFNIGFGASGPYWTCVPDEYADGILAFDPVWMGTLCIGPDRMQ